MWQGTVESLHIVAEKSQPMATVETIRAVPGRGLEGDRYANGKGTYSNKPEEGRQVTLFEQETLEALRSGGSAAASVVRSLSENQLVRRAEVLAGAPAITAEQVIENSLIGSTVGHLASIKKTI